MNALTTTPVPLQTAGRRFVLNLSFGMFGKLTHFAVGLFLIGYVVRHLGSERYGLIVIATTMTAFLGLIQTGTLTGLGRHLNLLHARSETRAFGDYFSAGTLLVLLMAGAIAAALMGLLATPWGWTSLSEELRNEGRWVAGLIGCSLILSCLTLPPLASFQAIHRIDLIEKISVVGVLLRAGAVIALFELWSPSPVLYSLALVLEQLLVFGVAWGNLSGFVPDARVSLRNVTQGTIREVAGFNFLNLMANVNYVTFMQAPAFVLQRFEGLALAGLYGIGLQLNNLLRGLLTAAINAVSPVVTSLHSEGNVDQLRNLFRLTTKCFLAAAAILWVLFYFLGETFLKLWLQRNMLPLVDALPWLMAASALGVAAMPASVFALALGRLRLTALSGLVLSVTMTGCMIGLIGSGWHPTLTRISLLLALFFGTYQIVRVAEVLRLLDIDFGKFAILCLRSLIPAALAAAAVTVAGQWWPTASFEKLLSLSVVIALAGGAGIFWILFSETERSLLKQLRSSLRANSAAN